MGEGKVLTGLPALVLFLATAAYWMIPEGFASATLGKLVCGLRVVGLDGQKITFLQSVQRNLLRIKDSFPFYLTGFIAARLSPLRQRLGDLWAKTIVVSASSAVPNQPQIQ